MQHTSAESVERLENQEKSDDPVAVREHRFALLMGGGNESIRHSFSDSRMPWPYRDDGRCAYGGVA
jgi:hypothetical protein